MYVKGGIKGMVEVLSGQWVLVGEIPLNWHPMTLKIVYTNGHPLKPLLYTHKVSLQHVSKEYPYTTCQVGGSPTGKGLQTSHLHFTPILVPDKRQWVLSVVKGNVEYSA